MALSFPSNPSVNDTSVQNGRTYKWSGSAWEFVSTGGEDTVLRSFFVPPAPTSVTATGGNAQATVSWTAPTVLAQTPITDYVVQYSSNSGSSWTTFSDGTSTSASATVTGLTNGTAYTFRVAAVNGVGTGAYSAASSAVTPQIGDPLFGNVSLLLHMDGSDNSTTFTDASAYGRSVTAHGDAKISTSQSKWGGASGAFDGAGDWLSAPCATIGTQDFALEFWMRTADVSAYQHIIGTASGSSNFMVALLAPYNGAGAIGVGRNNVAWDFVRNATLSNNTWHYVAVSRDSGTMRIYVDGSLVGSSGSNSLSYPIDTLQIGAQSNGSVGAFNGFIDDMRLTIGNSRGYTGSNITVPTAAFPDS